MLQHPPFPNKAHFKQELTAYEKLVGHMLTDQPMDVEDITNEIAKRWPRCQVLRRKARQVRTARNDEAHQWPGRDMPSKDINSAVSAMRSCYYELAQTLKRK